MFLSPLQLHSLPSNYSDLVVTGDDEGIFGVDAQFLYALKPLDREKQPSYSLQVAHHIVSLVGILWISKSCWEYFPELVLQTPHSICTESVVDLRTQPGHVHIKQVGVLMNFLTGNRCHTSSSVQTFFLFLWTRLTLTNSCCSFFSSERQCPQNVWTQFPRFESGGIFTLWIVVMFSGEGCAPVPEGAI